MSSNITKTKDYAQIFVKRGWKERVLRERKLSFSIWGKIEFPSKRTEIKPNENKEGSKIGEAKLGTNVYSCLNVSRMYVGSKKDPVKFPVHENKTDLVPSGWMSMLMRDCPSLEIHTGFNNCILTTQYQKITNSRT